MNSKQRALLRELGHDGDYCQGSELFARLATPKAHTHATLLALQSKFTRLSDVGRRACDGEREKHPHLLVTRRQDGQILFVDRRRPTCPKCAVLVDAALDAGKVVARRRKPFNAPVRLPHTKVGAPRRSSFCRPSLDQYHRRSV